MNVSPNNSPYLHSSYNDSPIPQSAQKADLQAGNHGTQNHVFLLNSIRIDNLNDRSTTFYIPQSTTLPPATDSPPSELVENPVKINNFVTSTTLSPATSNSQTLVPTLMIPKPNNGGSAENSARGNGSHRRFSLAAGDTVRRSITMGKPKHKRPRTTCEKITDPCLGVLKFIPLGIGTTIALLDTVVLGAMSLIAAPFCCGCGHEKELLEATSFQFKLFRVGLANLFAQTCFNGPAYIQEHYCGESYSDINGVLIETDGCAKKVQKGYFNCTDKVCCIMSTKQKHHLKERTCWTTFVSKLVDTGSFSESQVVAHTSTETRNFKVASNAKENVIKRNIAQTCDHVISGLNLEIKQNTLILSIENLVEMLISINLTRRDEPTVKELEVMSAFGTELAEKCSVEMIDSVFQIISPEKEKRFDARLRTQIKYFLSSFIEYHFKLDCKGQNQSNIEKIQEVCIQFDAHLSELTMAEDLLGMTLSSIKKEEVLEIILKNLLTINITKGLSIVNEKVTNHYQIGLSNAAINKVLNKLSYDIEIE